MDIFGRKRIEALGQENTALHEQVVELTGQVNQLQAELGRVHQLFQQVGGDDALHVRRAIDYMYRQHEHMTAGLEREKARMEAERQAAEEQMRAHIERIETDGRNHLILKEREYDKAVKKLQMAYERLGTVQQEHDHMQAALHELCSIYQETNLMLEAGLTQYAHPAASSVQLAVELKTVQMTIKAMVKNNQATTAVGKFYFDNSERKGEKFIKDMSKMCLQTYNAVAENCIMSVKAGNGERAFKRMQFVKDQVARLGAMIQLQITDIYHQYRLRELELALAFQNAKKAEKEAEREERARLREERKAQEEFEREREKLRKEQTHYQTVLERLRGQGDLDEVAEYERKLAEIQRAIEDVDSRAANVRAGYVYVISNIGAFGPNMVKIGLTRRLDPMDRVRELGDASVPFNFDVHALFFSEDAVSVENALHNYFAAQRVNLINRRREFFSVTPAQVREALKSINGNLLEFVEEPEAEQFRLSVAQRNQAQLQNEQPQ